MALGAKLHGAVKLAASRQLLCCKTSLLPALHVTGRRWAGHSKWQNIRHIKGAKDDAKMREASRISQRIRIAIKEGGGSTDPKLNRELANCMEQAKAKNIPGSTIDRAIKGFMETKAKAQNITVEARGPGRNCLLIMEASTAKPQATRQNIQSVLKKHGGSIGESGVAQHSFDYKGVVSITGSSVTSLDAAEEAAIEAGAEDVQEATDDEGNPAVQFITDPSDVTSVRKTLEELGYDVTRASREYLPTSFCQLSEMELDTLGKIFDKLELIEEVERIFDNVENQSA